MSSQKAHAFRIEQVSKSFGTTKALSSVCLSVEEGEVVGIVGPSGSGKTTLLRLLGGMLQPSAGQVQSGGRMVAHFSRKELLHRRRNTGFIHQSLNLVPELKVLANVLVGRLGYMGVWGALRALLWPRKDDLLAVHKCLERVALTEKMYARTSKLSGGQQQRVAIARVLFQDPTAIFADEPISAVDPARARDLLELLSGINQETGKTIIVSLHNIELAKEFCSRLVGMRAGQIVFDKPAGQVTEKDLAALYELEARS
ncbi:MAG: phosphonate transport system ATP-binding protein [Planctomycetota bacterium]|jgi:phosphonate transport system ATP-binding protein